VNKQIKSPGDTCLVERRVLRWLLFFYCLFILYGTFIPFRFNNDPVFVQAQWSRFTASPFARGTRAISTPDLVANILLLFSFGFLWVSGALWRSVNSRPTRVFFSTLLLGVSAGSIIEVGQIFSPGRIASSLDALCNGVGAGFGALRFGDLDWRCGV
jgi:VanZ family protein